MKSKVKKPKRRKTEIVDVTFKNGPNNALIFKIGDVQLDSCIGMIQMLCAADATIKLEILPNLKEAKDKNFPGEDLRYCRGEVIRQVK